MNRAGLAVRRRAVGIILSAAMLFVAVGGFVATQVVPDGSSMSPTVDSGARARADFAAMPDRLKYALPDDAVGFVDKGATQAPGPGAGAAFARTLVPISATVDRGSPVIGYYLPNYGFVSTDVVNAPGFNLDDLVAIGASQQAEQGRLLQTWLSTHPSVTITALVIGGFDQKEYTVPAGKVTVHLTGAAGITLAFADHRFRKCLLATDSSGPHTCRVTLTPGSYRIYDTIPGHRAAGYEATILVPEPGR